MLGTKRQEEKVVPGTRASCAGGVEEAATSCSVADAGWLARISRTASMPPSDTTLRALSRRTEMFLRAPLATSWTDAFVVCALTEARMAGRSCRRKAPPVCAIHVRQELPRSKGASRHSKPAATRPRQDKRCLARLPGYAGASTSLGTLDAACVGDASLDRERSVAHCPEESCT